MYVRISVMDLVDAGLLQSDRQIMELAERYGTMVVPSQNEDLELTHWWVVRDDGAEILYVGTPETFAGYVRERNGGIH
jgi:hypothetical protein